MLLALVGQDNVDSAKFIIIREFHLFDIFLSKSFIHKLSEADYAYLSIYTREISLDRVNYYMLTLSIDSRTGTEEIIGG